jgi:putative sugar O-methyltransferase
MDTLSLARGHFADALNSTDDGLPDPGPRWGTIADWCREKIPTFETVEQAVHFAQDPLHHGGFELRQAGDALEQWATESEAWLAARFPDVAAHLSSFCEPEISLPSTTTIKNGRRVSGPMYQHVRFFLDCATRIPAMNAVCEIGGGFGAPARLALTNSYRRPDIYTIVDLPESLFFAEVYLSATLGAECVSYFSDRPLKAARRGVTLCPVSRLTALAPLHFDLAINTWSMQEMTDDYVSFYRDWLVRQAPDHFYSWNYFLQPAAALAESANLFAPRLPAGWNITLSETWDNGRRPFCAVLASRVEKAVPAPDLERPLVPDKLFGLLHAADNAGDARLAYQLLVAMLEDLEQKPKETLFLCHRIAELEQLRPTLKSSEWEQVVQTMTSAAMPIERARVPPHLIKRQRSLYQVGK